MKYEGFSRTEAQETTILSGQGPRVPATSVVGYA